MVSAAMGKDLSRLPAIEKLLQALEAHESLPRPVVVAAVRGEIERLRTGEEEIPGFGEPNVFLQVDEKIEIERSGDSTQEEGGTVDKEGDSSHTSPESNASSDGVATDS